MSCKLKVGVASTASIAGGKVIPAFRQLSDSIEIVGVGSRSLEKAVAFCEEHDAGKPMSYEEMLKSDADAFYVPLPSGVRNDFIRKSIQEGKHIYSEKPHSGSVSELRDLVLSCEKNGLQWIDGTMWYHSNRTLEIAEKRIDSVGQVKRVTASFTWGPGLVDEEWVNGGNGRTDPSREPFGMLGDSGHYPISAILWAYQFELPVRVLATNWKFNKVGAIIACDAHLTFPNGGVGVMDTSCEIVHRSQFEIAGTLGVLKVNDFVGGQGRSGDFNAYLSAHVGSSSFIVGDALGKDDAVSVEPCDHVVKLVETFTQAVNNVKAGGKPDPEWPKRSIATHTVMCTIFESIMRGGVPVDIETDKTPFPRFVIDKTTYEDLPTKSW